MPGRADAERDGVHADGVDVALLAGGLRTDGTSAIREQDVFAQGGRRELGAGQKIDGAAHVVRRGLLPRLGDLDEVGEQGGERLHFGRIAFEDDGVAAHGDARGRTRPGQGGAARRAWPTTSAMFTLSGAVKVICVWSVMRPLYHGACPAGATSLNRQGPTPARGRPMSHAARKGGSAGRRHARPTCFGQTEPRASPRAARRSREGERVERDGLPGDGLHRPRARRPLGRKGSLTTTWPSASRPVATM